MRVPTRIPCFPVDAGCRSRSSQAEEKKAAGNNALKEGKFEAAAALYSEAIALDGTNHVYYSNRSNALVQLKRYQEALADAERTVELDPKFARGYGRKGVALFYLQRYEEAAAAYSKGLELEPNNEGFAEELERCQTFLQAAPFLRPDWAGVLGTSQLTAPLLNDPAFVAKIQAIRSNPTSLPAMLADQEIQSAYLVLSGLEQKVREDQRKAEAKRLDEQLKRREATKKREEEEAARKKQAEFDALPENKRLALRSKEEGNTAYKANDFTTALQHYNKSHEHDPTDVVVINNMAAVHIALKEYAKAVELCDKALVVALDHGADFEAVAKVHFRKAKALSKLERWAEAVKSYDEGLVSFRDPASVKLRNQAEEKMKQQAERDYLDPVKGEEAKALGNEAFKREEWGDGEFGGGGVGPARKKGGALESHVAAAAIRAYSDAIKRNPNNATYYSNRAISYIKVREYALALADANKCVQLDPSFIKGWVRKGMAHHYLKEYYKALEAYDMGFKIDPEYEELKEWAARSSQAIQRMHQGGEGSKEEVEEARKRALQDPEIQALIKDGEVQNLMVTLQSGNQKAAQEMLLKSKTLMDKYQRLSAAGIV